ncbi:MAG: DUF2442 domain-containing protein [Spirosoma sp.]|nr:DUF2442 domain-containing protein [Spirosoma sp.]
MSITAKQTVSTTTTTAKRTKAPCSRPKFADLPTFINVRVEADSIRFELSDGRTVSIPLAWSRLLSSASVNQRNNFIVSAYNVFWDDIDEIIGVENILFGKELYL